MSTHPLLYYRAVLSPWGTRLACTDPLSPEAAASPLCPSPFSVPEIQRAAEDSKDSAYGPGDCLCPPLTRCYFGPLRPCSCPPVLPSVPGLMPVLPVVPVRSS